MFDRYPFSHEENIFFSRYFLLCLDPFSPSPIFCTSNNTFPYFDLSNPEQQKQYINYLIDIKLLVKKMVRVINTSLEMFIVSWLVEDSFTCLILHYLKMFKKHQKYNMPFTFLNNVWMLTITWHAPFLGSIITFLNPGGWSSIVSYLSETCI